MFLASAVADKDFEVAIKAIPKKKIPDLSQIRQEVSTLQTLDHPNIIKYYETYENQQFIYVVMEYCPGGELFDVIAATAEKSGTFDENEARRIMGALLQAVNHCHANKIAHRDIKPENIMIGENNEVKLIDFGLSRKAGKSSGGLDTMVGTPYYVAPEVLEGSYGYECDIWSLGVLLYILLSGYLPFGGDDPSQVFDKILQAKITFKQKEWNSVSEEAKDLVMQMLTREPKKRITASKAINHEWFKKTASVSESMGAQKLDFDIINSLRAYKGTSKLKKAAMNVLVKMLAPKEIEHLREKFMELDKNNTGYIDAGELTEAMKGANVDIAAADVERIIHEVDYQGNAKINYSEFLAATISAKSFLTDTKLQALFKQFDTDNTDYITADNIYDAFQKMGREISRQDVENIMAKHDILKDGRISFQEFKEIFREEEQQHS